MISFSDALQAAIESELKDWDHKALSRAVEKLSLRYRLREQNVKPFMAEEIDRYAYIAYRMPATFAVVLRVLDELNSRLPEFQPRSFLDLGAGPGTALWAAAATFASLQNYVAIERDSVLIALAKRLIENAPSHALQNGAWQQSDLSGDLTGHTHDIVISSYAIGELNEDQRKKLIALAWKAAQTALVIIEPGTPVGYQNIIAARSLLIDLDAHIVAPCTHANSCPLKGGDWCHFSQRLNRTQLHRLLKGGALGHEDEKFSYLIATKLSSPYLAQGRILRNPKKHSGHLELILCTAQGLKEKRFSRSDGKLYKLTRKLGWGDVI